MAQRPQMGVRRAVNRENGPMGLMSTPVSGSLQVTDHDLTIDVNLGILERLIPADKARQVVCTRLKGLLK